MKRSILVSATLLAAGLGWALGYPAVANAEWDVAKYDNCVGMNTNPGDDLNTILTFEEACCHDSGGVWNANQQKCQAPPAQGAGTDMPTQSPKAILPTVPVQPPVVGSPSTTAIVPAVPVGPRTAG